MHAVTNYFLTWSNLYNIIFNKHWKLSILYKIPDCCVRNCYNSTEKGFSMRSFPTNLERRALWMQNINMHNGYELQCQTNKNLFVCEVSNKFVWLNRDNVIQWKCLIIFADSLFRRNVGKSPCGRKKN